MPREIAQRELRNDNARIMDEVVSGESFVITRNGVPVAELRPLHSRRRAIVPIEEIQAAFSRAPQIDLQQFRTDTDRAIDPYL